jgi:hypothetical protein
LLRNPKELDRLSNDLVDVIEPLTKKNAGEEVARIVMSMLA